MNKQEKIQFWSQRLGENHNGRWQYSLDDLEVIEHAIRCLEKYEFDSMEELEALNKLGGEWVFLPEIGEQFPSSEAFSFVRLQLLEALSHYADRMVKHISLLSDEEYNAERGRTLGRYHAYRNACEIMSTF
jgi:hypothetical protein